MADITPLSVTILLDGTQYTREMLTSAQSTQQFGQTFQATMRTAQSDSERFLSQLQTQAETFGMNKSALAEYRAEQLGVTQDASKWIDSIRQAESETAKLTAATKAANDEQSKLASNRTFLDSVSLKANSVGKSQADVAGMKAEQLGVGADAAPLIAQWKAAEDEAKSLAAAEAEAAAAANFLSTLNTKAETFGKSASEAAAFRAAELGVSDAAAPMISKLAAAEQAMEHSGFATAGARRELLVLGHEAVQGNWKNLAGSMMVLGERTDAMSAIMSATGLTIAGTLAVMGLLAFAAIKGAEQQNQFNAAMMLTGNYAGLTQDRIIAMTTSIADSGSKVGIATSAVLALAESGRFTSSQIQLIGAAAADMASVTGQAIKTTVEQFSKLAEDPTKASAALNEQYHYLTASVFEQIDALQKHGDVQGAADVAEKAYAAAIVERTHDITDSLGALQTAWRAAGQYASEAWDSMLNIGKTETVGQKIAAIGKQIDDARSGASDLDAFNNGSALGSSPGRIDALKLQQSLLQEDQRTQNRGADRSAQTTAEEQGKITAISWLDGFHNQFASQAAKRKKEIDEYLSYANRAGVSPAQQTTDIAAINDKYKDKAPKKVTDDEGTKMLQRLRDQDAATQTALTSNDKLTDAEKQQAEFLQQIADLKNKSILTADQKSLLARQDEIKAQFQQNVNDEKALKTTQDINKVKERSAQLNTQIADYQQNQQEGYQRTLGAVGLGTDAQQQVDATRNIYKEYERLQAQLTKATPEDALKSPEYQKAVASIKSGLDKSLADYSDYYAQLKAKQGDWTNGAAESWANYRDAAANVMDQTKGLFDDVFSGMETSIQNFEATGKLSFTALANSIITDLERIAAKAAVTAIVGELGSVASQYLPSLIGGATGGVGTGVASAVANVAGGGDKIGALYGLTNGFAQYKAAGGLLNGPGTGTSDSIPVMASDGEFIVKQSVVAKPGVLAMLNALNGGQSVAGQSHFATGGYVGSQASTPAGSVVSGGDIHITLPAAQAGPQSGYNKDDAARLKKLVQGFVDDRLSRQMRGQGGVAYNLKNGYM